MRCDGAFQGWDAPLPFSPMAHVSLSLEVLLQLINITFNLLKFNQYIKCGSARGANVLSG